MKTHLISAGDLQVSLQPEKDGLLLRAVTDKKSGARFLRGGQHSLFTLTAREKGTENYVCVNSQSGWGAVSAGSGANVHTFTFAGHKDLNGVTVILSAAAGNDSISWTVRLYSENEQYALYECDYPALSFNACSKTKVFFPYGCGETYNSVRTFETKQNYPSYGASMQYMALWHEGAGRGIYYGLHDPAPAYKKLFYKKSEGEKVACMKATMPLRDIDMPCNSQSLEGLFLPRME